MYDRFGRLVEGTSEGGVKRQNLTIDPYGNITRNTTRVNGVIDADRTMNVSTATNRLPASGSGIAVFGTYDDAGSLITHNGTWTYGYDRMGMVSSVTGGAKNFAYVYTADDQRLWEFNADYSRGEYSLRIPRRRSSPATSATRISRTGTAPTSTTCTPATTAR